MFGTRPEAIKMAPVYFALRQRPGEFAARVLVTAQHRAMLDQVLNLFGIRPDYDLNVMRPGQDLADLAARMIPGLDRIFREERPDLVLVQGDTSTAFFSALIAFYRRIPVGHVEAGLRTRNKYSPFPEELNRRLTAVLADWHFAPTSGARKNLLREGVPASRIFIAGNPVIDALLKTVEAAKSAIPAVLNRIDPKRKIILITAHRRENLGRPLRRICKALLKLAADFRDVEIVLPAHPNPRVRSAVLHELAGAERIHLCEPLDYGSFVQLLNCSYLVLTDSGGIQEEAPALGKPVLVLREATERPEAVRAGTVVLVGTSEARIYKETARLLKDHAAYEKMARAVNPYGDGRAATRIVEFLRWKAGFRAEPPEPFAAEPAGRKPRYGTRIPVRAAVRLRKK